MINGENDVPPLIISYFNQLTNGCDNIECQEEECCSSPNFVEKFNSPTEAAVRAVELSLIHPFNSHLCGTVNEYLNNPKIAEDVQKFDIIVKNIINNTFPEVPDPETLRVISTVVSSEKHIPYILQKDSRRLSSNNMQIDDNLFKYMPIVFQRAYNYFLPYNSGFHSMVERFIKSPHQDTYSHVRGLVVILLFDVYFSSKRFVMTLVPLTRHIIALPTNASQLYWACMQSYNALLKNTLSLCESQLSVFMLKQPSNTFSSETIYSVCTFITLLNQASSLSSAPLKSSVFSNEALCKRLSPLNELEKFERGRSNFLYCPSVLNLKFKHKVLKIAQENKQSIMATRSAIQEGFLTGRAIQNEMIYNVLEIRRDHLVEDAIRKIPRIPDEDLMKKLVVIFTGEQGIDQGGVSREFFYLLINSVFSPDYGMFSTINGFYWFSLTPFEDYSAYAMLGTVVSLAIYNNVVLPIRFPTLLYKKIINKPLVSVDLIEIDPDFVSSAEEMIKMRQRGEDVSELYLTFSTTVEQFGQRIEVPLIPNGASIDVTNENLDIYIAAYVNWWGNVSIKRQYEAFALGFSRISISKLFSVFAADELDILVSGEVVLDWEALRKNAKYVDGYNANSPQILWFWELFDEMSADQKEQFLRFSTGSARSPVGGLGEVALKFQRTSNINMLPVSHTCFNMFSLPAYPTKEILREKVLLAIEHTEGFGLV